MHKTSVDIPESTRKQVIEMLSKALAGAADLQSQVKQAHWNVKGPTFYSLHLLFDEIAEELTEAVDDIAERITAIGGTALGTVRIAAHHSPLPEYPSTIFKGQDHVVALAKHIGLYANIIRGMIDPALDAGDAASSDLFVELTRLLDKRLWFIEAHLQG